MQEIWNLGRGGHHEQEAFSLRFIIMAPDRREVLFSSFFANHSKVPYLILASYISCTLSHFNSTSSKSICGINLNANMNLKSKAFLLRLRDIGALR
jgi:hypothetical protein